ncbi:hypothetical protein C4D60_Mb01t19400 [Musa balbisiana]|uniref:Uncharacterized protein n=1 Tax=Musa balbisiana TaxID=52838 RepID=A0A4V4H7H1_MUSBA|nr:hypothetical protein C4D60_Mb01t19400 [Musa balbisiana]
MCREVAPCEGMELSDISLKYNDNKNAPQDSPNTDGIHIADSTNIQVVNSVIGSGDDCISIGPGYTNLTIFNVLCGPGHDISDHSLVKIKNIKYRNIMGTFLSPIAYNLVCREIAPCEGMELSDISLKYNGNEKQANTSICVRVYGSSNGNVNLTLAYDIALLGCEVK